MAEVLSSRSLALFPNNFNGASNLNKRDPPTPPFPRTRRIVRFFGYLCDL